jgi:hypothetical protein
MKIKYSVLSADVNEDINEDINEVCPMFSKLEISQLRI